MKVDEVRRRLRSLGVRADKGLGQHFLMDGSVARRSVSYASIRDDDTVLEIGPGLGILTTLLSERAGKVVAVEKEARFIDLVSSPNVVYIHGDALKVALPDFDIVVSNLPYSISSPITFRLLEPGRDFRCGVLMYQKEFAERLASGPGSKVYSRLSVNAYVRAKVELIEDVPRGSFYPRPKVDSCVVRLTPRKPPFSTADWKLFHRTVKVAFSQRRKKLRNSLKNGLRQLRLSDPEAIVIEKVPYADMRPEQLTPEQFGEVTDFLCGKGKG